MGLFELRGFQTEDLEEIYELHLQGMLEQVAQLTDADLPLDLQNDLAYYNDGSCCFLVGCVNETVTAIGALVWTPERVGVLRHLMVSRAYRSQGQGEALLDRLMDVASEKELLGLRIEVPEAMHAAQGLLKKKKFKMLQRFKAETDEKLLYYRTMNGEADE